MMQFRSSFSAFLVGLIALTALSCKKAVSSQTQQSFSFNADAELAKLLPELAVTKDIEKLKKSLSSLNKKSQEWCKSPTMAAGLLRELTPEEKAAFSKGSLALRTVLGCDTWFILTDKTPEVDFAFAQNAIDKSFEKPIDCVSVGFLQPYILGSVAHCASLTFLDVSFRTLYLHSVLLPLLTAKNFAGVDAALASFESETKASMSEICNSYSIERCKLVLMAFAVRYKTGLQARFMLSSLSRFKVQGESTALVYMSNAVDPNFMPQEEFDTLKKNWSASKTHTMAVYHQADSTNFGVYSFEADALSTVCANQFIVSRSGTYSKDGCTYFPPSRTSYKTYFDAASSTKGAPTCQL